MLLRWRIYEQPINAVVGKETAMMLYRLLKFNFGDVKITPMTVTAGSGKMPEENWHCQLGPAQGLISTLWEFRPLMKATDLKCKLTPLMPILRNLCTGTDP